MARAYISTAHFHAPFDEIPFAGLGDDELFVPSHWPTKRSYFDTGTFRAPYAGGYYQDGSLQGASASSVSAAVHQNAPPQVRRFLTSGVPIAGWRKDILVPFNQVHPIVYGALGVAALGLSYLSYKKFKKNKSG
jgi:hypothetical protein